MVWRRSLLSSGAVVAIVGAAGLPALPACFADLPAPIACPSMIEQRPIGACEDLLKKDVANTPPTSPQTICVADRAVHACLLGERASCACGGGAAECPEPDAACFPPEEECPAAVKAIAPNARCPRLPPEVFATQVGEGCLCGCPTCARICDGKGPTIGIKFPAGAGDPPGPITLSVVGRLPPRGRLSVYVRVRGIANLALAAGRGKDAVLSSQLTVANQARFVEMTFGPTNEWTDATMAPELVAIVAQPGPTMAEIDCIIPFVTP